MVHCVHLGTLHKGKNKNFCLYGMKIIGTLNKRANVYAKVLKPLVALPSLIFAPTEVLTLPSISPFSCKPIVAVTTSAVTVTSGGVLKPVTVLSGSFRRRRVSESDAYRVIM